MNWSIWSERVFISVAIFTLVCRNSYLDYLNTGVKHHTLTAQRTAPLHLRLPFPDQLLSKAEEEVARSEERHYSGQSYRKPSHFHPCASNDCKSTIPAWKQIRESQQGKKGCTKPKTFTQNRPRVLNLVNGNYCVKCVTGLRVCVCVPSQRGLNPSPAIAKDRDLTNKSKTVNLLVNCCVANAHSVIELPHLKT